MDWNKHVYINLDHRSDRNKHAINEIKKLDVEPNRFSAIKMKMGAVGCVLSHIKCIQQAKENKLPYICIFEDDLVIRHVNKLKEKVDKLFDKDWDVLLLGGNNFKPYTQFDDYIKVNKCFTTTSYIVKEHYYDTLLNNYRKGCELLLKTHNKNYILDVFNHQLQRRDKWYLIIPIQIYQRPDYSDIENQVVDYKKIMCDYDK